MVAKRKTKLPEAWRSNPYSELSREELDAALAGADGLVASLSTRASAEREDAEATRRLIIQGYMWLMVREGKATWSGGKPKGSNPPIEVTPGPPISDCVIEDRG